MNISINSSQKSQSIRYCICVSGQLREPEASFQNLSRLVDGLNVKFVFSLWDRVGIKADGAANLHQLHRMFRMDVQACLPFEWYGSKRLELALPTLRTQILEQGTYSNKQNIHNFIVTYFPEAVIDIEDADLLDLNFPTKRDDRNSIRMLYKIWRANTIAKQLMQNGSQFDVVLRVRPDLVYENFDLRDVAGRISRGEFLVNDWRKGWCGDTFAAGNPDQMNAYCSTFARTLSLPETWTNIHVDLADTLQNCGVTPTPYTRTKIVAGDHGLVTNSLMINIIKQLQDTSSWSPVHNIVWASLSALSLLDKNQHESALGELMRVIFYPELLTLGKANGWLYALAKCFYHQEEYGLAALTAISICGYDDFYFSAAGRELCTMLHDVLHISSSGIGIRVFGSIDSMQTSLKNNQKLEHILETHLAMSNEFFSDMLLTLSPKLVLRILRNSDSKNGDLAEIARSLECNVKLSELSADEIRWLAVMAK